MSRTYDHIDVCHRPAAERRRAGAPEWDMTIDIGSILAEAREANDGDPDDATVRATATRIAALVRATVPPAWLDFNSAAYDRELEELVEKLEFLDDPDDIDTILDGIFDWADTHRIWMGGLGAQVGKQAQSTSNEGE